MKLDEMVVTLEQAQKLKEIGFERDSLWAYNEWSDGDFRLYYPKVHELGLDDMGTKLENTYPAYTASELMDILPEKINSSYLCISKNEVYYENIEGFADFIIKDANITHALGDMLIYLLQNNLLPVSNTGKIEK